MATQSKGWPSQVEASLKPFYSMKKELAVEKGFVLWGSRMLIPENLREKLFNELHYNHPGICKMKGTTRNVVASIELLTKSCQDSRAVNNLPAVVALHPWIWPSRLFQRVHTDLAGPFQGAVYLVAMDAHLKRSEVL